MPALAVNGGSPLRTRPFPSWPVYDDREMQALGRVLRSGVWGTLGGEVTAFARRFAHYQHCEYGVAVTNGTVSLEIVLAALDIGYGDEVIIPPYTFNATASAVIMAGATPVFADVEAGGFNIDPDSVEAAVTPRTKAVIPVHVGGRPCDMDRIAAVAGRHGLYVVEDAAHAHGSEWRGKRAGSLGDAGSFSFQGTKNLCAGEGGMITTNNRHIHDRCWAIHHCGRDPGNTVWYSHPFVGTNARMTEWQAAVLDAQMDRLDGQIERRQANAAYLDQLLGGMDCIEVIASDERVTRNSYHLYVFKFNGEGCGGLSRDAFCRALQAEGIPCSPGYRCLYRQGLLTTEAMKRRTGATAPYDRLNLPNAEDAQSRGMWFAQSMLLADRGDMEDIAGAVAKIRDHWDEIGE